MRRPVDANLLCKLHVMVHKHAQLIACVIPARAYHTCNSKAGSRVRTGSPSTTHHTSGKNTPPPHTRRMFILAAAALMTTCACAPASYRPSNSSVGIMLAPRTYSGAPLTRKRIPNWSVPSAFAFCWTYAASAAIASNSKAKHKNHPYSLGSVSLPVTSATKRKPIIRDVDGATPVAGANVAVTLYSGCAPKPSGHHSLIAEASATSDTVILLSPAGSRTGMDVVPPCHAPAMVSMPFTSAGAQKCVRTANNHK